MIRKGNSTLVTYPDHIAMDGVDFARGDRVTVTCDGNDVSAICVEAHAIKGWVDVYVTHNHRILLNHAGEPALFRMRGEVVIVHEKRRERVAL
jgi:hypothetical protein